MKKVLLWVLLLLLPVCAMAEIRGYEKGMGYQYVSFGQYPYEKDGTMRPVIWRVLDVENGHALLLTEDVIDAQQAIFETDQKVIEKRTYRRISAYDQSDLYTWMNTEALDTLLGNGPERNALMEEPGGGRFFILTSEQFLTTDYGFSNDPWNEQKSRQAVATPYARQRGAYRDSSNGKTPYWAATIKGETDYKLQLVGYNGHLSWGAYTRVNVGLRPSVRLDLNQMQVASGDGTLKNPYVLIFAGKAETPAPEVTPTAEPPAEETEETSATLPPETSELQPALPVLIGPWKGE